MASDAAKVAFELVYASLQAATVHLELGLAGTAGADTARLLRQAPPRAPQTGQPVAELGQLDLGLALRCAGVLGEDVEDHRCAVQSGAAQQLLQVELLRGTEVVIEHHRVAVDLLGDGPDLAGLARAHECGGIGSGPTLADPLDGIGARGVHQQAQLVEGGVGGGDAAIGAGDADQHDPLPEGPIDEPGPIAAELAEPAPVGVSVRGRLVDVHAGIVFPGVGAEPVFGLWQRGRLRHRGHPPWRRRSIHP